MLRHRLAAAALFTCGVTLAIASFAMAKDAKAPKPPSSAQLARGTYLVTGMGCTACHTPGTFYGSPDPARFLAGSELGWSGPWGVVYAANLTPDPETGIGYWTAAELAKAIRTGNRPDGRQLAVIMPWQNFAA